MKKESQVSKPSPDLHASVSADVRGEAPIIHRSVLLESLDDIREANRLMYDDLGYVTSFQLHRIGWHAKFSLMDAARFRLHMLGGMAGAW